MCDNQKSKPGSPSTSLPDQPHAPERLPAAAHPSSRVRRLQRYRHLLWAISIGLAWLVFWSLLPVDFQGFLLRGLCLHPGLAGMLFLFALLALSLLWSGGQAIDTWMFLHLNTRKKTSWWLDLLMLGFTQLGSGATSFLLAGVVYLLGQRLLAYGLILGALTLWLLVELMKAAIRRPRPFIALQQARVVGMRMWGRSFPSGHTSQAFFLVTFLARALEPGALGVILLYFAAVLVGLTRMYVGAHYPRDVAAGAILGRVWGVLAGIAEGRIF